MSALPAESPAVLKAQALLREMTSVDDGTAEARTAAGADADRRHSLAGGAEHAPPPPPDGGEADETLDAPALRRELARARKHKSALLHELDHLRGALEQQRAAGERVRAEKADVVLKARMLAKELAEANKADDAALRRMLVAATTPIASPSANGAYSPHSCQTPRGAGHARTPSRGGNEGAGSAPRRHGRTQSWGAVPSPVGAGAAAERHASSFVKSARASVGERSASGGGLVSAAASTAAAAAARGGGGGGGGGQSGEATPGLSLASAASQILMLRKEVKYLQKQWNGARRERDAMCAAQAEAAQQGAADAHRLRLAASRMAEQLAQQAAERALYAREISRLRALCGYRVAEGLLDAAAAAPPAGGALGGGGGGGAGAPGAPTAEGAGAGAPLADWESVHAAGLIDERALHALAERAGAPPASYGQALSLCGSQCAQLAELEAQLHEAAHERTTLVERLVAAQEERMRLLNLNDEMSRQAARERRAAPSTPSDAQSAASSAWAAFQRSTSKREAASAAGGAGGAAADAPPEPSGPAAAAAEPAGGAECGGGSAELDDRGASHEAGGGQGAAHAARFKPKMKMPKFSAPRRPNLARASTALGSSPTAAAGEPPSDPAAADADGRHGAEPAGHGG